MKVLLMMLKKDLIHHIMRLTDLSLQERIKLWHMDQKLMHTSRMVVGVIKKQKDQRNV